MKIPNVRQDFFGRSETLSAQHPAPGFSKMKRLGPSTAARFQAAADASSFFFEWLTSARDTP
jgi:hypothetical protein